MLKKISTWLKLLFLTRHYSSEFSFETSLSFAELKMEIENVFNGSYINSSHELQLAKDKIIIRCNSSGLFGFPFFDQYNQSVDISLKESITVNQIMVRASECKGGLSNSILMLLNFLQLFFVLGFSFIIPLLSVVHQNYFLLVFVLFVPVLILLAYWSYSQRLANISFHYSKLYKTIQYLESEKPISIIRGIWS